MKTLVTLFVLLAFSIHSMANNHPSLEKDAQNLQQRYLVLKAKTESYNEYKVIRESLLDSFWQMALDSINEAKAEISNKAQEIKNHQLRIDAITADLQAKESEVEDILHAGTHISFLGIDFGKGFFKSVFLILVSSLLAVSVFLLWSLRSSLSSAKESRKLFEQVNAEYEDYKRKSLEKQMKLSRELQNERNKLLELRHAG